MENKNFYQVTLGGGAGVFSIRCASREDVRREIENNADGYFTLTIWEMADEETALRRCDPAEFMPDEPTERPAAISTDAAPAVQLDTFQQQFNREYETLYNARDNVAGYQEAVKAFDEYAASADGDAFIGAFVKHRGDFISSDREAAAFMFAISRLPRSLRASLTLSPASRNSRPCLTMRSRSAVSVVRLI